MLQLSSQRRNETIGTELINLRTKDQNGQKGYPYYKQKYGDRFVYIGCNIRFQPQSGVTYIMANSKSWDVKR